MNGKKGVAGVFFTVGIVFFALAVVPFIRGGHVVTTYVPLALVFFILGAALARRARRTE